MTRSINYDSRPKHEAAQLALTRLIADLRIVATGSGAPDDATVQQAIATIHDARIDLERCQTPFSQQIYYGQALDDPLWPDHLELIQWLTDLSMDLHVIELGLSARLDRRAFIFPVNAASLANLDKGQRLVNTLSGCRERLRFER